MRFRPLRWALFLALGTTTAAGAASMDEVMRLAQAGDVAAQRQFGQALLTGRGIPQDIPAGVEWLQQAASQKDPHAAFLLAQHFERLGSAPANHNAAVRYYRQAAALGHTTAQARLGEMLLERTSDPSLSSGDRDRARTQGLALLEFAANARNGYASLALAAIKTQGRYGVAVDQTAGLDLYQRAAAAGQTAAAVYLADHFLQGKRSPEDEQAGVGFLIQAANDGVPGAMHDLAARFASGRGVPQDLDQADQWAQRARAAGANTDDLMADIAAERRKRNPNPGQEVDLLAVVPKRIEVANPPPSIERDGDKDDDAIAMQPEGLQDDLHPGEQPTANSRMPLPSFVVATPTAGGMTHLVVDPITVKMEKYELPDIRLAEPAPSTVAVVMEQSSAVESLPLPVVAPAIAVETPRHTAAVVAVPVVPEFTRTAMADSEPVSAAKPAGTLSDDAVAVLTARLAALETQVKALESQRSNLEAQLSDRNAALAQLRQERVTELQAADQAEATVEAVRKSLAQVAPEAAGVQVVAKPIAEPPPTVAQIEQWNEAAIAAIKAKDYGTALNLLASAGDAGDGVALNNLGMMYMRGYGTPANTAKAITYFERAVAVGHGGAANNLGYIFARGAGVGADREIARKWYRRGVELGNAASAKALQKLDATTSDFVAAATP